VAKSKLAGYDSAKTPESILSILDAIAKSGGIILGGQAIGIWSTLLQSPEREPWASLRPYTSLDADGLGESAVLADLAKRLTKLGFKVGLVEPKTEVEKRINTGVIYAKSKNLHIGINILSNPLGMLPREIVRTAQTVKFAGAALRVLHPVLCVEGKAMCLAELVQNNPESPRQDEPRLRLALANLRVFLARLGEESPSQATRLADRVKGLALDSLGVKILKSHKLDVLDGVPWHSWKKSAHKELKDYADTYENVVAERASNEKREKEGREWIEMLKNNAPV
jgi:hypothetical protein